MSIKSLKLRFKGVGKYNEHIFIASSKIDDEKDSCEKLKEIYQKLLDMKLDSYLPIFHNAQYGYSSVSFKFYRGKQIAFCSIAPFGALSTPTTIKALRLAAKFPIIK